MLLSTEAEDCDGVLAEWMGVPMFMSSFDSESVIRMVEEAGFKPLETSTETPIEQGHTVPYLWILAQRL